MLISNLSAGSASAQSDPYGQLDLVYIDSVEAGPGEDVAVRFHVRNDEALGSLSIPISYDTGVLTLKSISFLGSRVDYIETKIVNPDNVALANGHFVVAVIQILESPLQPGDGPVFTALFTVSDSAVPGSTSLLDSLFYPPGGDLLLVSASDASEIHPAFAIGKVTVGTANRAPVFNALNDQSVLEGDTLMIDLAVTDADNDSLTLAVSSRPTGASFVDNGNGTGRLTWVPGYVGPNSAEGSPFALDFWASDGIVSIERQVLVQVINRNRTPLIEAASTLSIDAGRQLSFTVRAIEPDFEPVEWNWSSSLSGATFDEKNPGHFVWQSQLTDTGTNIITFVASDPQGFADTSLVTLRVNPASIYTMRLDTAEVFPGDQLSYAVILENMLTVGGFNMLFNVDPTAFTVLAVTNVGTRSAGFEYFSYTLDENSIAGNIRLRGIADQGSGAPLLPPGQGPIAELTLRASSDVALSGMTVPVRFQFLDAPTNDDNTFSDSTGNRVNQVDIMHYDGYIRFTDIGNISIGDINLNGLAAEIADVIYFTNYFIDPGTYPFNALQYANSDVNGDKIVASISDLIALINRVTQGTVARPAGPAEGTAMVSVQKHVSSATFTYDSDVALGGLFLSLKSGDNFDRSSIISMQDNMEMVYHQDNGSLKVLLYSMNGGRMPAGTHELLRLDGVTDFTVDTLEAGTTDGYQVAVALENTLRTLPGDFVLEQNYPNPFNPTTNIAFTLPVNSSVHLVVFNVLGREVRRLIDDDYAAGSYTVLWDGRDDNGQFVASGVYLYRLDAGDAIMTRKMMLLK